MMARALRIITPHEGTGGTTPSPRNDNPDSRAIAAATARLNCTSSGPAIFGRIVRSMMRGCEAPSERIASTYWCDRTDSTPA